MGLKDELAVAKRDCAHLRCGKAARKIAVLDNHDSNAGTYYIADYCSLECFLCDVKHAHEYAAYARETDARAALGAILDGITS